MYLIIVLLIVLLIVLILVTLEDYRRKYLFCPNKKIKWTPSDNENLYLRRNISGKVEECEKGSRGSINLWDFVKYPSRRIVLFCHGTNGNITQRKYVYDFCKIFNLNLILFDYFGYGESSGEATETTIYYSSRIAIDYCKQKYTNDLIIWGESLGGTVATYLAKNYVCNTLVLMSTFSSLDDAVNYSKIKYMTPKIVSILKCFYNTLPTKDLIKDVSCPILIVHSCEDNLISIQNAELIYLNCLKSEKKKIVAIKGSHISPTFTSSQFKSFLEFCNIDYDHLKEEDIENIVNSMKNMSSNCFLY